jgi:cbb3-type cytochrome oxidase subunit 1
MMDPFARRFIRASLLWLGTGVLIGLAMALRPADALAFRPAHAHANLLGFVSMMIFGVAYHVIPRFTGRPLHSPAAANAHLWIANAGLAGMVSGFIVRVYAFAAGSVLMQAGAALSGIGAFLFIFNIWRTLDVPAARPNGLPTMEPRKAAAAR